MLYLPPTIGRKHGSIVAVAGSAADASLDLAQGIANQARETLLVLAPAGSHMAGAPKSALLRGTATQDMVAALGDIHERLIVLTRSDDLDDPGFALAAARGVPVLVTEPI